MRPWPLTILLPINPTLCQETMAPIDSSINLDGFIPKEEPKP